MTYVINKEYPSKIYKNVLTEDEIASIYDTVSKADKDQSQIVRIYCQKAYHVPLPENIVTKIENFVNKEHNDSLKLSEISFASYSKEYGEIPLLSPHFDNTFKEPRITFDIQVRSNIQWPISVRGREFTLKDNEALTFSGTHQIHWRPYREFKDNEFIDMIFCHFTLKNKPEPRSADEVLDTVSDHIYHVNKYYQDIIREMKGLVTGIK